MARKIMILALVFFGMVCMASAIDGPAALKDAANAPIAVENNDVIGIVDGTAENGVLAAAPIGGPVPANAFPTISLPSPPNSGATIGTLDFFSIATTVVFVAIAGSFFF
uniref:Uncharacterized protein LOC104229893 n=1 Tax=Nicotiana sylvestris TaxID=4096 RepID=A0A1U7WLS2_NICSY|nr:PREDICTED: uncharacterized protein LOC104229893 [Nicotiana sylvestris]